MNDFLARHRITRQMASMTLAGAVALIVLVAAVVALPRSSTKSVQSQSSGGVSNGPGSTGSGSSGNVPGAGSAGTSGAPGGGSAGGGRGSAPGEQGSSAGGSTAAHVSSKFIAARAPGITNTTIYAGVAYSSQSAAGDRAIGGAGAAPSYDTRNVWNAVIDYANNHGGFAGRRLKAMYYDFSLTANTSTQEQSACANWTQDNKSFLVNGGDDILDACAEKAHAIAIGGGAATTQTFKKYPHLIDPDFIATDRLGQVTVVGLHKAGYFAGKLGLVTWDDPNYRQALNDGYIKTLSKYHITAAQIAYISVPQSFGALGDMTAAVSSAVAKFKGLNIDHVMIQDGHAGVWSGDGLTFEWEQQSKSQNYYPRYGGNSNNAPGFAVNPHDEENHELAVDQSDNDKQYDEGWHINATREKCFKIEADAGYPVSSSNTNDEGIAALVCDRVFFFQRVINGLPLITSDNFINAAQHLGTSFPTAAVYGAKLFPGRRDGGDMVRTEEYLSSCQCLKYRGPPSYAD